MSLMMTAKGGARMQVTLLGGGGFRAPLVHRALSSAGARGLIDRFVLHDVEPRRLKVIASVLEQMDAERPGPAVETTTDLDRALAGADFVFSAIRVGGAEGRVADEREALSRGLLGQETMGAGGIAFGLRTVPEAVRIAERVKAAAPSAWVVNFTNPAGMITGAMQRVLGGRVIGICDSPAGLVRRATRALGIAAQERVTPAYAGLNHLGWLTGLSVDGTDRLPELLADPDRLESMEEGHLFGARWLQSLGMIPNEYLYYVYSEREAIASIRAGVPRGAFLQKQQALFYERTAREPSHALQWWRAARDERDRTYLAESRTDGGTRDETDVAEGGYEGIAVAVMAALSGREPADLIVDVAGRGALPRLPEDAVVEVRCRVDEHGARPYPVAPLPGHAGGLVQQVAEVERLTIRAALERSRAVAEQAIALHPLVDSVAVARDLLSAYGRVHPALAYLR